MLKCNPFTANESNEPISHLPELPRSCETDTLIFVFYWM